MAPKIKKKALSGAHHTYSPPLTEWAGSAYAFYPCFKIGLSCNFRRLPPFPRRRNVIYGWCQNVMGFILNLHFHFFFEKFAFMEKFVRKQK